MYKIYLSYRRNDLAPKQVALIHTTLEKAFGVGSTFWDKHMKGATKWKDILKESNAKAKVCLVLIGSNWNELDKISNKSRLYNFDDWVRIEIEQTEVLMSFDIRGRDDGWMTEYMKCGEKMLEELKGMG